MKFIVKMEDSELREILFSSNPRSFKDIELILFSDNLRRALFYVLTGYQVVTFIYVVYYRKLDTKQTSNYLS